MGAMTLHTIQIFDNGAWRQCRFESGAPIVFHDLAKAGEMMEAMRRTKPWRGPLRVVAVIEGIIQEAAE
jgi:hypothetical protein